MARPAGDGTRSSIASLTQLSGRNNRRRLEGQQGRRRRELLLVPVVRQPERDRRVRLCDRAGGGDLRVERGRRLRIDLAQAARSAEAGSDRRRPVVPLERAPSGARATSLGRTALVESQQDDHRRARSAAAAIPMRLEQLHRRRREAEGVRLRQAAAADRNRAGVDRDVVPRRKRQRLLRIGREDQDRRPRPAERARSPPATIRKNGARTGDGIRPSVTIGSEKTTRTSLASARDATSPDGPALTTVSGRLEPALPCPAAGVDDEQIRDRSGTISAVRNMINPLQPVVCVSREIPEGGRSVRERAAGRSLIRRGRISGILPERLDTTPPRTFESSAIGLTESGSREPPPLSRNYA